MNWKENKFGKLSIVFAVISLITFMALIIAGFISRVLPLPGIILAYSILILIIFPFISILMGLIAILTKEKKLNYWHIGIAIAVSVFLLFTIIISLFPYIEWGP